MKTCEVCGAAIPPYSSHHKKPLPPRRTCSRACTIRLAHKEGRWHLPNPPNSYGASNTNWKGGKKRQGGYIYVLAPPDHPVRGKQKGTRRYIAEHRLVMERHLGRYLDNREQVHHRNGVKDDNRIENLEVVTRANRGWVICPHCRRSFQIR